MSQDWRERLEEQAEAGKRRREAQEAQYQAAKEAKEKVEYQRKLAKLQRKFKCHVCGTPATGPGYSYGWDPDYPDPDDWDDIPAGLERCCYCRKWTCGEHYHMVPIDSIGNKGPVCIDHA